MAHEIEIIDGQAQMAYAGEVPWHGLGTQVSADLSPQEMLVAAGLDWQVVKKPLLYGNSNEKKAIHQKKFERQGGGRVRLIKNFRLSKQIELRRALDEKLKMNPYQEYARKRRRN